MGYQDFVRSDAATMELGDVLRASPAVLLGVSPASAKALARLGVETVFDLARSTAFHAADQVVAAATDAESPESRLGGLPSDLLTGRPDVSLTDAPSLPVGRLRAIATADGHGALATALDVTTIRDLSWWPPYRAAEQILDDAINARYANQDGTPGDLLPMSGRYPTERAYYSAFVLADVDSPVAESGMALEDAGPLDPLAAINGPGFTRPVRGARVTLAQSWYSQGVALGQLLHSLALAPGESTRVAMIDWSRQQTGTQQEQGGQTEQLMGDIVRKRAMSEVQNAVAHEAQNGFTDTTTASQQMQAGGTAGFSLGPLTLGGSLSDARTNTTASTVTGTSGVRDITATMTQNVADATHQAASSARNMFASVVRELSQAEHENISTRVVANYNHMHALTVQYYEVVQVYRSVVNLHRFEPCLFVPMQLLDFLGTTPDGASVGDVVVRRYRAALQAGALDTETTSLLDATALGLVRITPNGQGYSSVLRGFTTDANGNKVPITGRDPMPGIVAPSLSPEVATALAQQIDQLRRLFDRDAVTRAGNAIEVPDEMTLEGLTASFPCAALRLSFSDGSQPIVINGPATPQPTGDPFQIALEPVSLSAVSTLDLDTSGAISIGVVTLNVTFHGVPLQIPLPVALGDDTGLQQAATFQHSVAVRELLQRLQDDQLHYSQVVWQAMDSATVGRLIASYSYLGQPLSRTVDPTPIGVAGNYLIFRMPWEARDLPASGGDGNAASGVLADADWLKWVRQHANFEATSEDLVPLPSGGVFAEAVLGRSNSAEKLDITRFWNWQDSPIPIPPPDIAAIQSGSRAQQDNTTPTGFATPIVAFNNPPALPDPAGLGATLGALANGGMFRDMSGASTAQALALAALSGAGSGATAAGQQAAAAAAAAAQKEIEMAKLAAGLVTGGAGGGGTVSEQGAKINEGRSLDERSADGADATAADSSGSHEAQAAEGLGGHVLQILGSVVSGGGNGAQADGGEDGGAKSSEKTEPVAEPATTASSSSSAKKSKRPVNSKT